MTIFEQAKNPASRQRPVPFWSWNDKLEDQECRKQIGLMDEQGIGGFFMHARGGLHTDYLSQEWFQITKACIDEAKKRGMNAWAYDENGWPSGFGGGQVNGMGVFYQQKYLRLKMAYSVAEANAVENRIAVYDEEGHIFPEGAELPGKTAFLVCYYEINPYYVDTLDGRVIAEFLRCTHQKYFDALSPEERATMRGFFTDEPQVSRNGTPWSLILEEEYRSRFHEELRPRLPQLFREWGKDYRRTRYRFWRTVTELFSKNFMKQIHDWCEDHKWELTGHLVLEETLLYQLTSNGACMPHYEYFHIPGMDILCRDLTWVTLPLQLFSVASQTGKRQILSETFALCGWAVSFADLQWLVQWQMVHGVNLVCQHLEGYSLRGLRKRDYPASLFRHQPWWEYYKPFNDYISRVGTLLAAGDVHYRVLVMHPQSTAQMCFNDGTNGALSLYEQEFKKVTDSLEAHHVNHHYGDEIIMERHASVSGGHLVIGEQSYDLVILPKLNTLTSFQAGLLSQFVQQGGVLLGLRNDLEALPFCLDGEPGEKAQEFQKLVRWFDTMDELVDAVPDSLRAVRVLDAQGQDAGQIHCTVRHFDDFDGKSADLHYFVNNERFQAIEALVSVPGAGVEEYDTHTGEIRPVSYTTDGKTCLVRHRFPAAGDLMLLSRAYAVPAAPAAAQPAEPLKLSNNWRIGMISENLLTLDHCRCVVDGEELFPKEYVLTIQDALLAREKENQELVLEYDFEIGDDYDLSLPMDLLVETPEQKRIFVNGQEVPSKSHGYFADPAFERIFITDHVKKGRNVVRLESTFHQFPETFECLRAAKIFESERNKFSPDSEVESIYIAGHFGVHTDGAWQQLTDDSCRYQGGFVLGALNHENVPGDRLQEQGLPFFAGDIALKQTVMLTAEETTRPHAIEFRQLYGSVLDLEWNGRHLAVLTRPDYRAEIPVEWLKVGENQLKATLVTSLRNMLGPHHLEEGDAHAVGPWHFFKTPGGPFTIDNAAPWNDGYCFYRHGVSL